MSIENIQIVEETIATLLEVLCEETSVKIFLSIVDTNELMEKEYQVPDYHKLRLNITKNTFCHFL